MKDTEIRGLLLEKYYEKRRLPDEVQLTPLDFAVELTEEEIGSVSAQLGEHGLIEWLDATPLDGPPCGFGRITAKGIDVVEGSTTPPIAVHIHDHTRAINVHGSTNVVVGDGNIQNVSSSVQALLNAIDESAGTADQKAEAKSQLKKFLEHPLVAALAGGAIGLFGS